MTAEEIIACQEKYDSLKSEIDKFLKAYINVLYKKVVESYQDYNNNVSLLEHTSKQIKFKFYNYTIFITRENSCGIPQEILKENMICSIQDITINKPEMLFGRISVVYADNKSITSNPLLNMYVNSEGVYKIDRIISGTKTTFVDDSKTILTEILSRIYTKTFPLFPEDVKK